MYAHWQKRVIRFLSRGRLNFSKFITDHNQATKFDELKLLMQGCITKPKHKPTF